jgi:hypothetical protein
MIISKGPFLTLTIVSAIVLLVSIVSQASLVAILFGSIGMISSILLAFADDV